MKHPALTDDLIPALKQMGFELIPLNPEDKKSREIRSAFPFGRMTRQTSDGIHLLEIQIHKHNPKKFRINLGIAPLSGINHPHAGHVDAKDMCVHYLPEYYEIYRWPQFRIWLNTDVEKLFPHLLKEIENLFKNKKTGRFMRRIKAYTPPAT